jgi:hypothetical protein
MCGGGHAARSHACLWIRGWCPSLSRRALPVARASCLGFLPLLFEFCAACSACGTFPRGTRRCWRSRWKSDPAERGRRSGTSAVSPFCETCLPAYGSFRSPTSSGRAVYPAPPPSLSLARWMNVGRRSRCIYAAGDLALISLRVSLLLLLSSRGLYQHELNTSMHRPRDCGVLLAAPCRPGAVRRRRDVAVPCDDYFFGFSFIVIFCGTC